MNEDIMPIFRERSEFYKKYSKMLIQDMLKEYDFFVEEEHYTQEDFNEIGTRKKELMAMGITNVPINLKENFSQNFL